MEKSIFEQMGGTHHQEGDYLLPDLAPPERVPIDIWGQRWKRYLKHSVNLSMPPYFSAAS